MRRYIIFTVAILTLLTAAISGTVVAVAFPNIVSSFNTSLILAGWVLSINQLACTMGMPLVGKIGDAYGNKSTFIFCICLFTGATILCALAPNIETLILFRFIQGFGMGGFLPTATALIAEQFPDRRQQAIGLLSSGYAIGTIIGPNLGGWLTESFGWQSTFWVFVPFGFLMMIAMWFLLPKTRGKGGKLDLVGAGFLTSILSAIMVGISLMGNSQQGIPWVQVSLFFALSAILLIIFLKRQAKVKNPIIDVQILQEKRFLASNVYNFVVGIAIFAITSFIPLYAVSIFNMSTFYSGLVMTPRSIGVLIASIIISLYLIRWGYRKPMIIGTIISSVSLIMMGIAGPNTTLFGWQINGFLILSFIMFMNGVAQGIVLPAANNACIELMPEKVGTITGVRGMFRQVGGAIGISVTTLTLHNSGNMQQGFFLVLMGTAVILLMSLPLIFMMPKNANVLPVIKDSKQA
jgi:EmrB/QacA subfamily drug resistance transporter